MHESSGKRGEGKRGEEDRGRKGNALRKEGEEDGYTRITPRCACACVRSGRRSTRSWSTTTKLCGPCRCTRDRPSFPPLFFSRAAQPLTTITYRFTFTLSSLSPIIILRIIRNPPSLRSSLLLFDRYPFKGVSDRRPCVLVRCPNASRANQRVASFLSQAMRKIYVYIFFQTNGSINVQYDGGKCDNSKCDNKLERYRIIFIKQLPLSRIVE